MGIQIGMTGRGGEQMKRKTYVRRGAIILAVMMLVSLCGMLPTAALAEGAPDPAASPQEAAYRGNGNCGPDHRGRNL